MHYKKKEDVRPRVTTKKERKCLRCDKKFFSGFNGNRLCEDCKRFANEAFHWDAYSLPYHE